MDTDARPADTFSAVTTSDTTDLTKLNGRYPRALYVGTGGDVVVVNADNVAVTFKNAASGSTLPVKTKRVNSASTTATDIVALY